jgi:alpha-D-xyloside xylohydrolase
VITLDGRAAWNVETRFDFEWDPERFPDPRAALAAIKRTTCGSASGNIRTCPSIRRSSPISRRADICSRRRRANPYVFGWDTSPGTSPFGKVLTPLPESGIVDFTHPGAYVWWRDAHEALFATASM